MSTIKILICGKNYVLNAYELRLPIFKAMEKQTIICPEFGKTIKSKKILGKGVFGSVALVDIDGEEYAVKKIFVDEEVNKKCLTTEPYTSSRYELEIKDNDDFWEEEYHIIHDEVIPAGSYICEEAIYSEFLLSILVSKFTESKKVPFCVNFLKTFGFSSCIGRKGRDKGQHINYIFMEKADDSLYSFRKELDRDDIISIVIQVIFAITCYQEIYSISHNDLHASNIFLKVIEEGSEYYPYTHFHYKLHGQDIIFPRGRFLVKIGDFGIAVKWSAPIIGFRRVLADRDDRNPIDYVPNWYSRAYDILYSMNSISIVLGKRAATPFVKKIIEYMVGKRKHKERPDFKELKHYKKINSTKVLLECPVLDPYRKNKYSKKIKIGEL